MSQVKTILITGGSGKLAQGIIKSEAIKRYGDAKIIALARRIPPDDKKIIGVEYYSADICDEDSLMPYFNDVDLVIHAAAAKNPAECEHDPELAIRTNIDGTRNVLNCALKCGVKRLVNISTDMAVATLSAYGASKLLAVKLTSDMAFKHNIAYSSVRVGNILGVEGNIASILRRVEKEQGFISITDQRMTRFTASREDYADFIFSVADRCRGGEIFVPKIKSYDIMSMARAVSLSGTPIEIVGIRPGESLFTEMINHLEGHITLDCNWAYAVIPSIADKTEFMKFHNAKDMEPNFSLSSENNPLRYSVEELRLFETI